METDWRAMIHLCESRKGEFMSVQGYQNLHARLAAFDEACKKRGMESQPQSTGAVDRIYMAVADLACGCAQAVLAGDEKRAMDCLDFAEYLQDVGIRIERKLPSDSRLLDEIVNEFDQKRRVGQGAQEESQE